MMSYAKFCEFACLKSRIAGLATAALAVVAFGAQASAAKLTNLHGFESCPVGGCEDGSGPQGNLVMNSSGSLYGTTAQGGVNGGGTIFQLIPDGNGGWTYATLYNFCSEEDCADGADPQATLIIDEDGNLYGTTRGGGEEEGGGIGFKFERGESGSELIVIHNFCGLDAPEEDCKGGASPAGGFTYRGAASGAPYDGESPLYGASTEGGEGEAGMIYRLKPREDDGAGTPEKDKEEWRIKELYVFCAGEGENGQSKTGRHGEEGNCDDGKQPSGSLLVDGRGNLYGTTYFGGEDANLEGGGGVVFELTRGRADKVWDETVLYKFCSQPKCRDGYSPHGALTMDAAGNLSGAAQYGGETCNTGKTDCGVLFTMTPNGEGSVSRVLHRFCSKPHCADGATPQGALAIAANGDIYGATLNGGADKGGVVYRLRPDGKLNVLHSFCAAKDCSGARYPNGVILGKGGRLFGVATLGGKKGGGSVFRVKP